MSRPDPSFQRAETAPIRDFLGATIQAEAYRQRGSEPMITIEVADGPYAAAVHMTLAEWREFRAAGDAMEAAAIRMAGRTLALVVVSAPVPVDFPR